MAKKYMIDPGHGGTDSGASAFGVLEKDWNLRMSLYQYERLKALGVNISITRTSDVTLDSGPRTNKIKGKFDVTISNHFNAFNGIARGIETIHSINESKELATKIANALVKITGLPLRRVFTRKLDDGRNYYFMHRLTGGTDTVIIEYGFLDNKLDHDWYKNDSNFIKAAEAVIKVICEDAGVAYKAVGNTNLVKPAPKPTPIKPVVKSVEQLAQEVIDGKHGTGDARKRALGSQYQTVQDRVNKILLGNPKPTVTPEIKTTDQLAKEVIDGKHGTGDARKKALGNRYSDVQARVNQLLGVGSKKTTKQLADEVERGLHGNGDARKRSLGNRYDEVQREINRRYS